jgi:hypothetical protein
MQLLKEKTLTKLFVEQDNNGVAFYSLIQEEELLRSQIWR